MLVTLINRMSSMRVTVRLCLLLLLPAAIAGCQATGAKYETIQAQPGSSLITVYRPNSGLNGNASETPALVIDDSTVGILKAQGYLVQQVPAGKHEILITGASDKANWFSSDIKRAINVEPDTNLYFRLMVRFDPDSNNIGSPGMGRLIFLTPVAASEASRELKTTRLSK